MTSPKNCVNLSTGGDDMARLIIFTGQSVKSIFTLDGINAKYQFPDSVENAQQMNAMIEQSG